MEHNSLKNHLTLLILHVKSTITFGNMLRPHLLLYLLDTKQDPEYMVKFRHEMAHWLWGSMYGEAPAFLNEGVAVVAETLSAPNKTAADLFEALRSLDGVPPIEELFRNEAFWKTGTALYRVAGSFIYFITQGWGWERLAQLFRHTNYDDADIGNKFTQDYGITIMEAERQWRTYVSSKMQEYY